MQTASFRRPLTSGLTILGIVGAIFVNESEKVGARRSAFLDEMFLWRAMGAHIGMKARWVRLSETVPSWVAQLRRTMGIDLTLFRHSGQKRDLSRR